jgi:hypothetical protein
MLRNVVCRTHDGVAEARAVLDDQDGTLTVLEGSTAKGDLGRVYECSTRQRLLDDGLVALRGRILVFVKPCKFNSPCSAASFVTGRHGKREDWKPLEHASARLPVVVGPRS